MLVPQADGQLEAPDTVPENVAAVHVKVVPLAVELKDTLLGVPLQIV